MIVWGEATNHLESNAASRQRRRPSNAFAGPRKKYDVKKIFAKETWYKDTDEIGQGNDLRGSGKCTNRSNPSKSKPSHHSQGKLGQNGCWLYEDGYNSVKMNSGFSSFSRNSETKLPFSGSKIWMEDPSSELPVPRSDIDAIAEKFALHDSPISSKVKFGSTMPDLSPDSKLEGTPLGSLHLAGSHVETPFPDISAEESASREVENKAKIQPGPFKKLGLIEEICMGNGLFSENKKAIDGSSSGNIDCGCEEERGESQEVVQNLETSSPDHAERVSSSLSISEKLQSIVEEQEHYDGDEATLPCQNENKEIQDIGPQEKGIVRKTESNCDNSSCQMMMLESYVLQLLCVQNVPKDASAQGTLKKL
ncbi:hypothetical protein CMV_030553 [Castanea mollissima]|uniref:Uncharacterized protein n=1 Tax=Castanea mollissima TaxID=60419 RepID=A0A8J4Q425_9ROSI|nr:hypothetical protein CMV_030553 [Castanea mollissima]